MMNTTHRRWGIRSTFFPKLSAKNLRVQAVGSSAPRLECSPDDWFDSAFPRC